MKTLATEVAVDDRMARAKRPLTPLAGRNGHPVHPALVSVPLGAWATSLIFDIGGYVVDDPEFLVRGATWLIVIGVVTGLVAGIAGFIDLVALPVGTRVSRVAYLHMSVMLAGVGVFVLDALLRRGIDTTDPVGAGPLAVTVAGVVLVGVGGYLGGELAFRYGVRVAPEESQAHGYQP